MEYRDYRKFFTLPETAAYMSILLDPSNDDIYLEPSAGEGALVRAVRARTPYAIVDCVELNPLYAQKLQELDNVGIVRVGDFLTTHLPKHYYDGCIANPPFGNGVDLVAHVEKMRLCTKRGGRLVILVPEDFHPGVDHRSFPLQNWGTNKDGTVTPIKIIAFTN